METHHLADRASGTGFCLFWALPKYARHIIVVPSASRKWREKKIHGEVDSLYKIITVRGADAAGFLQGQLTQDIGKLSAASCLPAAWCNAQGRVLMTMRIMADADGYVLAVPADIAAAALLRLGIYRLRAQFTFELANGWRSFAVQDDVSRRALANCDRAAGLWHAELLSIPRVTEVFATETGLSHAASSTFSPLAEAAWRRARIAAGQVDIGNENSALYTPHMLNLDLSGAISFQKGCYIGQEIVARTEHLGKSKRRTLRYQCGAAALLPGEKLQDAGADTGTIVNACGNELLAVVPTRVAGKTLHVRGVAATPLPLPYTVP